MNATAILRTSKQTMANVVNGFVGAIGNTPLVSDSTPTLSILALHSSATAEPTLRDPRFESIHSPTLPDAKSWAKLNS